MSVSLVPEPPLVQGQTKTFVAGSTTARAALYGGLVAAAGTIVFFTYYFVAGEQQQKSFCCSDVIQLLASISNWSVDPCSNFVDFACYRVKHLDRSKLGLDAMETAVVRPVLRGQLKMAAASRLHTHHRSCLAAFAEGELSPENAVRIVLSMFRDWSDGAEHIDLLKVSVLDSARGLGSLRLLNTLNRFSARVGGHVVVSPRVYPMLSVDKGSQAVVNAASLGVSLADSLWDAVFSRREWSVPLLHRLDAHTSCVQRYIRSELGGRLSYPLLSVRSTVRAVSWPQWHARADDEWKLSASQVFFMLFVLRHTCLVRDRTDEEPTISSRSFMLRVGHFAMAFDCKPAPLIGLGSCL
ncbi:uncharacterized protein LOC119462514 [Dermacentor silvarum]|uniref:uncharacterized protein LOC119462514 n=1 Tax=Dermacentor silvarum TaxID=543639 RepID=UPI00189974C9|nr:uncharacterized protein LOC119462514 [Dermacentor silvarum]